MSAKPFKILGIQQIAIGGENKDRLKKLWVDMLGFEYKSTFVSERENVDEDICAIGSGAPVSYTHLTLPTNREV